MPQKEQKKGKGKKATVPSQFTFQDIDYQKYDNIRLRHGTSYPAVRLPTGEQWSQKVRQKDMDRAHSNPTFPRPQYKVESSRPQSTSEMESDEGQRITQEFLKIAKEHERKKRAEASQKSKTETEAVYEQIRGDTPPLQEEDSRDNATVELEKTGLMTTVIPTAQLGEGALRTALEKQNEEWKVNKTSPLKERSFVDYEAHIAQTFDKTPLERVNKEANVWPPPLVYGITTGGSSGDEMSVTKVKQPIPKKAQSPKIPEFTTGIQGDQVTKVTPRKSVGGDIIRAPFSMDFLFGDEEKNLPDVIVQETGAYSIRGNPAVIVQTKSWLSKYNTENFGVDLVTGDIYAIKNGNWDKIPEMAKIDKEQHSIVMSTTPVAGAPLGRQSLSSSTLPTTPDTIQPPRATSTGPIPYPYILTKSAERRRDKERHVSFFNRELMDEVLREESLGIIEELRKAEKAREQAEKEAQEVEKERKRLEEAKRESDKELERLSMSKNCKDKWP